MSNNAKYRQKIREQRQALPIEQQSTVANTILQKVIQHNLILPYQHIAFYYPVQGELNPHPIIEYAWQCNKCCYLPILCPNKKRTLQFMPYVENQTLIKNRYHIPEPGYNAQTAIQAQKLECVFVPLVAFDPKGHRLGMGGGFYDTTFAFALNNPHAIQLIGLAYEFQRVDSLKPQAWDVPLTAVITEEKIYTP